MPDDRDFKRVYKKHRVLFTDEELIYEAYIIAGKFADWESWLADIRASMGEEVIQKLGAASGEILNHFGEEMEGFSRGYITPEVSAAETLGCYEFVPKSFLEFLWRQHQS